MALIALIVGIGAFLVAFGSLCLSFKVHKDNRRISHEQRKQETLNVFLEAELATKNFLMVHRENIQKESQLQISPDQVMRNQQITNAAEKSLRTLGDAHVEDKLSNLTRVELEEARGLAIRMRTSATELENHIQEMAVLLKQVE